MFDLAFNDLNDILAMNGHGVYVWSVYSIAISIIVASFLIAKNRIKNNSQFYIRLKDLYFVLAKLS